MGDIYDAYKCNAIWNFFLSDHKRVLTEWSWKSHNRTKKSSKKIIKVIDLFLELPIFPLTLIFHLNLEIFIFSTKFSYCYV